MGVAGLSRLWLKYAVKRVTIKNYDNFKEVMQKGKRPGGLLTVSNHISTVDDPLIWVALLDSADICALIKHDQMRWTVGARELTFTNPLTSWFFERGQVIPIVRGEGIYQKAMDEAIRILNSNRWLHFFPEGRVVQYTEKITRLKWGVGRLIMESREDLTVLPMILKGFDLMKPNDLMPVLDHEVEIVIGDPVEAGHLLKATEHIANEDERRSMITKCIQDLLNETKSNGK